MGGVLRALRRELVGGMSYPMDDADYTVLTRSEVHLIARVGLAMLMMAQGTFIGLGFGGRR